MALKSVDVVDKLVDISSRYSDSKPMPAVQYIEYAEVGQKIADELISKAKAPKDLKEAKKKLKEASAQLKKLRKDIYKTVDQLGYETAPKHLWSVIQLIQQSQHVYTASGATKYDTELFSADRKSVV